MTDGDVSQQPEPETSGSNVRAMRTPGAEVIELPGAAANAAWTRVLHVPLAVTLRFGQRELRLQEVLELTAGSLVELDRQVDEPVDLVLGDRVIARGEVVIVDGNYGLRVSEVLESHPAQLLAA